MHKWRYWRGVGGAGLAPVGPFAERRLGSRRVGEWGNLAPFAQNVAGIDQHVDAVRAQHTDHDSAYRPHGVARLGECVRHSQDTRPQATLQQMQERLRVAATSIEQVVIASY